MKYHKAHKTRQVVFVFIFEHRNISAHTYKYRNYKPNVTYKLQQKLRLLIVNGSEEKSENGLQIMCKYQPGAAKGTLLLCGCN